MRTLTIEIPEPGEDRMLDVVDQDGRRCNGLSWDEMLGQAAMLTMPPARLGNGFCMQTQEQWDAEAAARAERLQAMREQEPKA